MHASSRIDTRNGDLVTHGAMPCRDAMSPPKLSADAPVVDVFHPVEISLLVLLRRESDRFFAVRTRLDGRDSLVGQRLNLDEPLRRKARFDNGLAAVAV